MSVEAGQETVEIEAGEPAEQPQVREPVCVYLLEHKRLKEADLKEACREVSALRDDLLRALGKSPGDGP